jgi:hypothetical protein
MKKSRKGESEKLGNVEAKARFEQTVKTMLNTPPKPHEPLGKRPPQKQKPVS